MADAVAKTTDDPPDALPRRQVGDDPNHWINKDAQADRDLSDKRGLTGAIEQGFAGGKSAPEVRAALGDKLGFVKSDQTAFVVNVRATLGIPSRATPQEEKEFQAWRAQREAPPDAAVAEERPEQKSPAATAESEHSTFAPPPAWDNALSRSAMLSAAERQMSAFNDDSPGAAGADAIAAAFEATAAKPAGEESGDRKTALKDAAQDQTSHLRAVPYAEKERQAVQQPVAYGPNSALGALLAGLRKTPPVEGQSTAKRGDLGAMADAFQANCMAPRREGAAVEAAIQAGEAARQTIKVLEKSRTGAILEKIRDAALANGGIEKVVDGMRAGGKFEYLRQEFREALKDDSFAAAHDTASGAIAAYAQQRVSLGDALGRSSSATVKKVQEIDQDVAKAAVAIPGKEDGMNMLSKLSEDAKDFFQKIAETIHSKFTPGTERGPASRPSPSPSP